MGIEIGGNNIGRLLGTNGEAADENIKNFQDRKKIGGASFNLKKSGRSSRGDFGTFGKKKRTSSTNQNALTD